jgi:transcriptional regulator with XRE-family HTH domain
MEPRQKEMLERIGARIRSERNRLGLSLEALAKKVGISKMTLQRIETGSTSPSVIILTDISFHLKQPIEALIKEGEPKVVVVKKGDQSTIFDPESRIRILAPKGLIADRLTVTYAELEAGDVIDLHQNRGFEWAFLIEGKAVVRVGTKDYDVEEGDTIFYDAHFPHSIRVYDKIRYVGLFLQNE